MIEYLAQGPRSSFQSAGAADHVLWSRGAGGGNFLCSLFFWLFRTVRLLNPSWVIVEQSHVYKLHAAEKDLSPAAPDLHVQYSSCITTIDQNFKFPV